MNWQEGSCCRPDSNISLQAKRMRAAGKGEKATHRDTGWQANCLLTRPDHSVGRCSCLAVSCRGLAYGAAWRSKSEKQPCKPQKAPDNIGLQTNGYQCNQTQGQPQQANGPIPESNDNSLVEVRGNARLYLPCLASMGRRYEPSASLGICAVTVAKRSCHFFLCSTGLEEPSTARKTCCTVLSSCARETRQAASKI